MLVAKREKLNILEQISSNKVKQVERYKQMIEHKKKQLFQERSKSKSLLQKRSLLSTNVGRGTTSEKKLHLGLSRMESMKDEIIEKKEHKMKMHLSNMNIAELADKLDFKDEEEEK